MHLSRRSAVGLVMMQAVAAVAAVSRAETQQQKPIGTIPQPQSPSLPDLGGNRNADDSTSGPLHERMRMTAEKAHNEDRRKRMLADTEKLLALSTELKVYLEKSTRDELSLDVIRKAQEIEKLAHDVQQRMKN